MSQKTNQIESPDDFWQHQIDPLTSRELEILRLVADGNSDREIADALFLSLNTVKWHNRQIYSKLGVSSRTQAVARASQAGLFEDRPVQPEVSIPKPAYTLPAQVTSFIGRSKEISDAKQLLDSTRLLTLTGPGGVGKTRLATQIAFELVDESKFEHGIFFVDLAPVRGKTHVEEAIVETLGIHATAGTPIFAVLENYLKNKEILLLFDNFEHLLEAAPLVSDLLLAAPNSKVLATSREALGLYGEQEFPVPPLSLPDLSNLASLASLTDHEAVALFIQRARSVAPDFTLNEEDAPLVAEICVRLDGLPLAIELAAARLKLFGPQALLNQIDDRFVILGEGPRGLPDRQRTLRGTIDWSYELLDDVEQTLFIRLSVFQGGRTIEAVEEVCCEDLSINVLDGLASLLRKNLLRQREGPEGVPRFTMLETIHEYARERLLESGTAEDLQRRHAAYFITLAERAEPYMRGGGEQMRWLRRMDADHDNLRTMYQWSMDRGEFELALRLVGTLGYFWWRQGHYSEGQQWSTEALELIEEVSPAVRASVYSTAGRVFFYLDDSAACRSALANALALYERLGSRRETGWAHIHMMMPLAGEPSQFEEAMANFEAGLALLQEVDDKAGIAQAFTNIGEQSRLLGDLSRAKEAYEESLKVAREIGDGLRESLVLVNLGFIALHEDDAEGAQAMFLRSLVLSLEIGHTAYFGDKFITLAGTAVALDQPQRAARLIGAADVLFESNSYVPQSGDIPEFERYIAAAREALEDDAYEKAWEEGRAMNTEEAIAYALEALSSE